MATSTTPCAEADRGRRRDRRLRSALRARQGARGGRSGALHLAGRREGRGVRVVWQHAQRASLSHGPGQRTLLRRRPHLLQQLVPQGVLSRWLNCSALKRCRTLPPRGRPRSRCVARRDSASCASLLRMAKLMPEVAVASWKCRHRRVLQHPASSELGTTASRSTAALTLECRRPSAPPASSTARVLFRRPTGWVNHDRCRAGR